jgi:hypothetical protein
MERAKTKISAAALPPSSELQRTLNSKLENLHNEIRRAWQSVIKRLVDTPTHLPSPTPGSRFDEDVQQRIIEGSWGMPSTQRKQHQEMARRLKKELADVEFRTAQGLDRCDHFFDDAQLLECRHSRSKSLVLDIHRFQAPLHFYSRALKGNNDVLRIGFICYSDLEYAWFAETISDLPSSVTSIWVRDPQRLPPIQRDTPLFIDDDHAQSLDAFLNDDQSLARTRDTHVFMQYGNGSTIAVSFFGPPSGNLRLRLKHRTYRPDAALTVIGTSFTLVIPESLTIDDINLQTDNSSCSQLSFKPNTRKHLILRPSNIWYALQDLQLLDEDENPYGQPSEHDIPTTEFDAHSMPDDPESWNFESDALHTPDDRESRDSESQQESPSSGRDDFLANANPVVAAGYDTTLTK